MESPVEKKPNLILIIFGFLATIYAWYKILNSTKIQGCWGCGILFLPCIIGLLITLIGIVIMIFNKKVGMIVIKLGVGIFLVFMLILLAFI